MQQNKTTISLTGESYNSNKREYKKILKKYGYRWVGNYMSENFRWITDDYEITAVYDRDNEKTVSVNITLQGTDEFIREVMELFDIKETSISDTINEKYNKEVAYHKSHNAPDGIINAINKKRKKELESI